MACCKFDPQRYPALEYLLHIAPFRNIRRNNSLPFKTNKYREMYESVLYTLHIFYMFRPLMWSYSGRCITKNRGIGILFYNIIYYYIIYIYVIIYIKIGIIINMILLFKWRIAQKAITFEFYSVKTSNKYHL
jgi:hypothetical protein